VYTDVAASVESVKAVAEVYSPIVAEVYSPISGVLKAVNTYLENSPGLVNLDPVADGKCVTLPCYSTCYLVTLPATLLLYLLLCYSTCYLVTLPCYSTCYPVTSPATLLLYRLLYYFTFYLPGTYCNVYC